MWILLSHFITLTWLFRISSCKPNFTAVFAFSYVCVLPSSNRAFMIRLLLPFSTMIGTACNEIHPSFWYSVTINDIFCCCSPSMRIFWTDILDSALIHLPGWHCVTLYCAFSNNYLCCKFIPNCILQLCDLLANSKNTTREFLQCCLLIFLKMSHCQTLCLLDKSCSIPVFAWYVLQPYRLFVASLSVSTDGCLLFS